MPNTKDITELLENKGISFPTYVVLARTSFYIPQNNLLCKHEVIKGHYKDGNLVDGKDDNNGLAISPLLDFFSFFPSSNILVNDQVQEKVNQV